MLAIVADVLDRTLDVWPGITWEEIAPPAEAEDGCFKALRHTWCAIYSEVLTTTARSVHVSKAGIDAQSAMLTGLSGDM